MLPGAGHGLDEFRAAETDGRPVLIDGNAPDRFEARLAEESPTGIAIDLAFVPFGGAFRVGKPDYGVTCGQKLGYYPLLLVVDLNSYEHQ